MSSNIYITPSTSLILIKSLARPVNIYLSTFNVPDFQVNVRDATGSSNLITTPITLSTIGGAKFTDNSVTYFINQPYGFVNMSLRTSTMWQLLHTSGQTPVASAANVQQINISTSYFSVVSSPQKLVSTMFVENIQTPNSILVTNPFVIGNLSTPGFVLLKSSLNVFGSTFFAKNLFVSGATIFQSSLSVQRIETLCNTLFVSSSAGVGGSLNLSGGQIFVFSTLHTQSSLQTNTLQVRWSTLENSVQINNNLSSFGSISTLKGLTALSSLSVGSTLRIQQTVSSLSGVFSTNQLLVSRSLITLGNISLSGRNILPPTNFLPTNLAGCQLWLDASDPNGNGVLPANGASIPSFFDKSGNGRNATQGTPASQPTYTTNIQNGLGGIRFNGTNSCFNIPNFTTVPYTIFLVCRFLTTGGTGFALNFQDTGTGFNPTWRNTFAALGGQTIGVDYGSSAQRYIPATSANDTNTHILTLALPSGSRGNFYFDGILGTNTTGFVQTTKTLTGITLGSYNQVPTNATMNGFVFELLWYNSQLSLSNIQEVELYLASKWGLSVPHPIPLSTVFVSSILNVSSSMQTESTITINGLLSTLSSATVGNILSTLHFSTNFLSSSASFSTSGDFSVLSTLTTKGNLSSYATRVPNLLSVGRNFVTAKEVSSYTTATLSTLRVQGSAFLKSAFVGSTLGIGEDLFVNRDVATSSLLVVGSLTLNSNLFVESNAIFNSNLTVSSDIRVTQDILVRGNATIANFDVLSYEVSTLQVTNSSPLVAVRASTFNAAQFAYVNSGETHLAYSATSGDIVLSNQPSSLGFSIFNTDITYAYKSQLLGLSTNSLYANKTFSLSTNLTEEQQPVFEIFQNSYFLRGFSSQSIVASSISTNLVVGRFIGRADLLTNVPLNFENVSANTLTTSSLLGKSLIIDDLGTQNINVSSNLFIEKSVIFGTPAVILSTTATINPYFYNLFETSTIPIVQSLNNSTLAINNTVFLNSQNRRVGILTSSPQYNLDISGSLYYSGSFYFDKQETLLNFSIQKEVVSFSTILYSSIYLQNRLILPENSQSPTYKYVGIGGPQTSFVVGERLFPEPNWTQNPNPAGIYANPEASTIDLNYNLITYANTRNTGIYTIDNNFVTVNCNLIVSNSSPAPLNPLYDLVVQGNFVTSTLITSSLIINTKIKTSTIEMPTLAINPITVSTFHTISSSYNRFTTDGFVEFYKDASLQGSLHINRPASAPFNRALFTVYSEAFISSVTIESLHTKSVFLGTQDL